MEATLQLEKGNSRQQFFQARLNRAERTGVDQVPFRRRGNRCACACSPQSLSDVIGRTHAHWVPRPRAGRRRPSIIFHAVQWSPSFLPSFGTFLIVYTHLTTNTSPNTFKHFIHNGSLH
jgi:hypothetical protein